MWDAIETIQSCEGGGQEPGVGVGGGGGGGGRIPLGSKSEPSLELPSINMDKGIFNMVSDPHLSSNPRSTIGGYFELCPPPPPPQYFGYLNYY